MLFKSISVFIFKSCIILCFIGNSSCHGSYKQNSEHSKMLANQSNEKQNFVTYNDENNEQRIGIMLNSNTVLVANPKFSLPPESLNVSPVGLSGSSFEGKHWNQIHYYESYYDSGYSDQERSILQVYKLDKKINDSLDVKFSEKKLLEKWEKNEYFYSDGIEKFPLKLGKTSASFSFIIFSPLPSPIKVGGAIFDTDGKIFGIITDTHQFMFACGKTHYGSGHMLNWGIAQKYLDEAKSGFPTKQEMNLRKFFDEFRQIVNFYGEINTSGVKIQAQEKSPYNQKIFVSSDKWTIHFDTYARITFEDKTSKDLRISTVYFASKDRPKMTADQLKVLKKVVESLRNPFSWWRLPKSEDKEILKSFARNLELYLNEQSESL